MVRRISWMACIDRWVERGRRPCAGADSTRSADSGARGRSRPLTRRERRLRVSWRLPVRSWKQTARGRQIACSPTSGISRSASGA